MSCVGCWSKSRHAEDSEKAISIFPQHHDTSELGRRGSRFAAARCHAKIMLIGLSDGTRYVSEASANIRACKSIEQFVLTNDPELHEFHRKWIDELMTRHGQT